MRFLLDQSTDARLVPYLRALGHDITRIAGEYPAGLPDADVLSLAHSEGRVLITDDRDFGELVFRHGQPHSGVIYLRLGSYADLDTKIDRLNYVLTHYMDQIQNFVVVGRVSVRVRQV